MADAPPPADVPPGADAPPPDAPPLDAPPPDAPPPDAPPPDAPPPDAPPAYEPPADAPPADAPLADAPPPPANASPAVAAPQLPPEAWPAAAAPPVPGTPTQQSPAAAAPPPPAALAAPVSGAATPTRQPPQPPRQPPAAKIAQAPRPTVATTLKAPPESLKREYVTAVKAYEQQVGPNIVRGKMFIESMPTTARQPMQQPGMINAGCNVPVGAMGPGQFGGYSQGGMSNMGGGSMPMMYGGTMPMMGGGGMPMMGGGGMPMMGGGSFQQTPMGSYPGAPISAQQSREEFKHLINSGTAVDFAKLADMGPEVRRLLDMGEQMDKIMDVSRRVEGKPMFPPPSGCTDPSGFNGAPMTAGGAYDRPPMNMPGGFGRPMTPVYGGAMSSAYSTERFPRDYGRASPDLDLRMAPRNARRPKDEIVDESRQPNIKASDLLQRIREDIDEHRAENLLEKIRRDVVYMDAEPTDVPRARRNSLPQRSRTSSRYVRTAYEEEQDDCRRSPRPRRKQSRRLRESSPSPSSEDRSHSRRSGRSSRGKRHRSTRRTSLPSKKSSSSSSSSSSSDAGGRRPVRGKAGEKSVEFIRKLTERLSSSSPVQDHQQGLDEFRQKYMMIARPGGIMRNESGRGKCPVLNMLGIPSHDTGIMRSGSRTMGGRVYGYGAERPPSSEQPHVSRISSRGALYRYESQPSAYRKD